MKRNVLPTIDLEDVGREDGVTPALPGLIVASAITGEILKRIDQRVHDRLSAEQMQRYRDWRRELLEKIELVIDQVR